MAGVEAAASGAPQLEGVGNGGREHGVALARTCGADQDGVAAILDGGEVPGLRAAQRTVVGEDVEQPLVHPRALGRRRESPCGLSVVAVDRVAGDDARRVRMRLGP